MDGLLIDSEFIWAEAAREVMRKVNFDVTDEIKRESTGLSTQLFLEYCYKLQPWDATHSAEDLEIAILDYAHEHIPMRVELMPGVVEVLETLKKEGLLLAVASASHMELIENVLRKLEILHYFDTWHSGVLEEFTKPHPAVYLATAAKLGVKPQECIAFEDSYAGLMSAHSAGMLTVSVPASDVFDNPKFDIAHIKIPSLEKFKFSEVNSFAGA